MVSLQGASLQAQPGELVAVMGPSGVGKSTLLGVPGGPAAGDRRRAVRVRDAVGRGQAARAGEAPRANTVAAVAQDARRALGDDQAVGARIAPPRPARRHPRRRRTGARASCSNGSASKGARRPSALSSPAASSSARRCASRSPSNRGSCWSTRSPASSTPPPAARSSRLLARLAQRGAGDGPARHARPARRGRRARASVTIRDGRLTGELHGANGRRWVFVDDGGLIRLDPDDLRTAGIEGAAEVAIGPGAVVLQGHRRPRPARRPRSAPGRRAGRSS